MADATVAGWVGWSVDVRVGWKAAAMAVLMAGPRVAVMAAMWDSTKARKMVALRAGY